MKGRYPKILFFIKGANPTVEEEEAAEKLGPNVMFRNANFVPVDASPGSLEQCGGVAGAVPTLYAKAFNTAEKALALAKAARDAEREAKAEKEGKKESEKTEEGDKNADGKIDSFELPDMTDGARKLIAENELSDETVVTIEATGSNGKLIKADVEKFLEPADEGEKKPSAWQPNAQRN